MNEEISDWEIRDEYDRRQSIKEEKKRKEHENLIKSLSDEELDIRFKAHIEKENKKWKKRQEEYEKERKRKKWFNW